MKKMILIVASVLTLAFTSQAATYVCNIAAAGVTNISATIPAGPVKPVWVLLSSDTTHSGSLQFFDTPYLGLAVTNAAYTSVTRYATNYVNTWTNFYGATNTWTNTVLQTTYVTNSAATNVLTSVYSFNCPTNGAVQYVGLSYTFLQGLVVTNSGNGTITLTVDYSQ
jgi:hypothetical protein